MPDTIDFRKIVALIFVGILFVLVAFVMRPIIMAVITALLLAYILYPVYKWMLKIIKEKNLTSLVIILLVFLLVFIPLWFLLPMIARQMFDIYLSLQKVEIVTMLKGIFPQGAFTDSFYANANVVFTNLISRMAGFISTTFTDSLINIPNFMLQGLIFFFTMFFCLRDADKLKMYMKNISPFSQITEKKLLNDFKEITNSIIYGSLAAGVALGTIMGIGFLIFNVPNALILTLLAALAAIIPVLGVWIIWVPVSLFLLLGGHVGAGLGLAAYSLITTFSLESIIRSYFIAKGVKLHSAVGMIGMIGGMFVFGILGLLIGPLVLSYFLMLLEAYRKKEISALFS